MIEDGANRSYVASSSSSSTLTSSPADEAAEDDDGAATAPVAGLPVTRPVSAVFVKCRIIIVNANEWIEVKIL
jgi:hypothetical protein